MMKSWNKSLVYSIYGFLIGLIFPLIGTILLLSTSSMEVSFQSIVQLHAGQPLMHVIDLAPIILAIYSIRVGIQSDRMQMVSTQLQEQITKNTKIIQEEHYFFQALVDNSPFAVVQLDKDHRIVASNPEFKDLFGFSDSEIIGGNLDELVTTEELFQEASEISKTTIAGKISRKTSQRKKKDGSLIDVEIFGIPVSVHGQTIGVLGTYRDISEQVRTEKALKESEARYRYVTQVASDAIIIIDSDGTIITWNNGAGKIFGYSEDEILGKSLKKLIPESYSEMHLHGLERVISGGERKAINKTVELEGVRKTGENFPIELSLSAWKLGDEKFFGGIIRDISERKCAEEKLRYISFHDALTGLYNRGFFDEEMSRLKESRLFPISIIVFDLDDLKQINDTYGHDMGDNALKGVAKTLSAVFRSEEIIARMGGDEFAVIIPAYDMDDNPSIATRLGEAISRFNKVKEDDGLYHPISLSYGFSVVREGESLRNGYKIADQNMYHNKVQKKREKI